MGNTYLQKTTVPDSQKHSAMQLTILVNIAAEVHSVRILMEELVSLAPRQKDEQGTISKHAAHVVESHSKDLVKALEADYK